MKKITKITVAETIAQMISNGENPTHALVKERLGGGSNTTISNGFKLYKEQNSNASIEYVPEDTGNKKDAFLKNVASSLNKLLDSQEDEEKNLIADLNTANQLLEQSEAKNLELQNLVLQEQDKTKALDQELTFCSQSKKDEAEALKQSHAQEIQNLKVLFEQDKDQLKNEINILNKNHDERIATDSKLQTRLEDALAKNQDYENELKELQDKLDIANTEKHSVEIKYAEVAAKNEKSEENLKRLEANIMELQKDFKILQQEKHDADIQAAEAKSSLEIYKSNISDKKRGRPSKNLENSADEKV